MSSERSIQPNPPALSNIPGRLRWFKQSRCTVFFSIIILPDWSGDAHLVVLCCVAKD